MPISIAWWTNAALFSILFTFSVKLQFIVLILHTKHNRRGRKLKLGSDYELMKNTPYLTPMGELQGVSSEFFGEKLPRDIESAL